tara:strand:+ start:86 stop:790 length:705 start_codon:yes stop_codon:yes gene_type:complete
MIIIVGASKGLGKSIANVFKDRELLLISRSNIETNDPKHISINLDINNFNYDDIKIKIEDKEIEAIFFTAGVSKIKDNFGLTDNEKEEIFNTNYLSIVKINEFFINNFKFKDSALICFCSSVTTLLPRGKQVLYCSAKKALDSYFDSLRHFIALKNINIRLVNLALGFMDTEMNKDIKTLFPKKNPDKIALYLRNNLKKINGKYYLPKYWILIKIVLSFIPFQIKLKIFNRYGV